MAGQSFVDLPTLFSLETEAQRLQAVRSPAPPPALPAGHDSCSEERARLRLVFVTYNVLTLRDPQPRRSGGSCPGGTGVRISGRRELLKQQFMAIGAQFIGLQETRTPDEAILPDSDYWMLHSPCDDRGHYGTALWLSKALPYGMSGSAPLRLELHHLAVVMQSPRCLVVRVDAPFLDLLLVVGHAPHEASKELTAFQFWQALEGAFHAVQPSTHIVLLVDGNAHLGSENTEAIGSVWPEPENMPGRAMHEVLLRWNLFAPSTHASNHSGDSPTWFSSGGVPHRLDYVIVSDAWRHCTASRVLVDFEALQGKLDHLPAAAVCHLWHVCSHGPYRDAPARSSIRPGPHYDASDLQVFRHLLSNVPAVPWHVCVDAHYDQWVGAIGQAWEDAVSAVPRRPRQTYLSPSSLAAVDERKQLRRFVSDARKAFRQLWLTAVLAAWHLGVRGLVFGVSGLAMLSANARDFCLAIALAGHFLQVATPKVRQAVKQDRIAYLRSLSDAVTLCDLRDPRRLYQSLRRAFPALRPAKRSGTVPLPMLVRPDGSVVASVQDKAECWRLHFSDQEAGLAITPEEYPAVFSTQMPYAQSHHVPFCLRTVPHLAEVEDILQGLAPRKAAGVDGITAEVLRLSTVDTARQLFPVFMKSVLGCREPTNWRGGQLICLAKKAAGNKTCDAFRSILLASIPGKAYHRAMRSRLIPALCATSTALQAGSKPGVSTDGISAAARAYQEYHLSAGRLPAVIYFDLKAAYYRMLRQLVVPIGEPEDRFLQLMRSLKLPDHALSELMQHLHNLSSLELAEVTPHTIAAVSDLFRGTWFRMDRQMALTYTARGSRPGDPLADVLFAFSLSTYIRSCDQALAASGFSSPLPALRSSPFTVHLPCQRGMSFASWADDMARLLVADTWPDLVQRVEGAMQVCTEHATACGMQFSFARHKTAVLLPAQTGRFRGRQRVAGHRPAVFSIWNRVAQERHTLEVIPVYQHLGSVVTSDGSPALEVAHRKAMAIGVTRAHTHRFFANGSFPLDVRRNILRSISVSKFTYGAAGLNLSAAVHRRGWCGAYVDIWRRLLRRDWATVKRTHGYEVLYVAQAPSPLLALALTRATFLRRLVLFGPAECLHLLQAHWDLQPSRSWFGLVLSDISLVAQYVESAQVLLQQRSALHALLDSFQSDDRWWTGIVRRACKVCVQDYGLWHSAHSLASSAGRPADAQCGADAASEIFSRQEDAAVFRCRMCPAAFSQRKLLCAHMAKTHGCLSPARHFAPTCWCLSCMGYFHSPLRVQQHLKQSAGCLKRLLFLIAPLTVSEVHEVEADHKLHLSRLHKGHWAEFHATLPAARAFGPRQPTADERGQDEDLSLELLGRLYRPSSEVQSWIYEYIEGRSTEGKRPDSVDFWGRRFVSPSA